MRKLSVTVISLLTGITIGYICGTNYCIRHKKLVPTDTGISVRIETITRRDTLRINIPSPTQSTEKEIRYVSIPLSRINKEASDSDTLRIERSTRIYADSSFRAVVSGANPRLDSLTIYPVTSMLRTTITPRSSRWGVGITA
ncbi:DUF6808 domain-containing protein, partial [uncultured Duncaniella sp.]